MDKITINFIKASFIYLVIGSTIGVTMFFWPNGVGFYRSLHAHLNVVGWLSMFVFGVAYHILPRFSGRTLHSVGLARAHLWLSNVGIIGLAVLWSFAVRRGEPFMAITGLFGAILAISIYFFVYNMWRTIKAVGEQ